MTPAQVSRQSSFCDGVSELLGKVLCRPAYGDAEREAIFRLRYEAYRREGILPDNAPLIFRDRFDDEPNSTSFGIYIDDRLVSSLRIHVVDRHRPDHPALHVFPDHLSPMLEAGQILIDPTRFVVDASASRLYSKLPYVTVRLAWMACEWFEASKLLATVRSEHQAFYKRLFGHEVACPPRPYPTLTKPLSLMVLDHDREHERVQRRYPFFASTPAERQHLFGRCERAPRAESGRTAMVA